ncbi:MAG: BatA domain-containing protein, partial [Pirellulaceae bacterium]
MSFIQIGFLFGALALAIPIIIHLVFRQRPKRVELGTLRFLRVVLEHNARRRRVMRWLLLALRMACVALLILLFARPYLLALASSGAKQTVVILIDRSASMELKQDGVRGIERAVADVRKLLTQTQTSSRYEIAFFDHQVRPLIAPQAGDKAGAKRRDASIAELNSKLVAPVLCSGATDYGTALEWARDVLAKAPAGPRILHVFTDFQQSGLAWSDVDPLPEDVATHLHDLGRAAVNNVAVVEARAERAWFRENEQTSLHVTVYNGSPFTTSELPVVLRLTSNSRTIELREQRKVEPGAMESLRFDLPPLAGGLWQGTVTVETEDDLPLDNQRHVALLAADPYQVLLIDGRASTTPVLSSTYLLEA